MKHRLSRTSSLRPLLSVAALVVTVTATAACGLDGDLFWIRRAGADLPVLVRGDTSSQRFLVLIHGGPGASSFTYPKLPAFASLERSSAVVYWDQRSAGASLGDPPPETLTLEDYAADTELVVDALRARYGADVDVILLGHSWGGAVGTAFLLDRERQRKVQGWVEMNGAHDLVRAYALSREYMLAYAAARLAEPGLDEEERARWQEAQAFYEEHEALDAESRARHGEYLAHAHGYVFDPANEQTQLRDVVDAFAGTPLSLLSWLTHMQRSQIVAAHRVSLTDELGALELPTLLLWGTHDRAVPVALADEAWAALSTPPADKHIVRFERSGHAPCVEEPEAFVEAVEAFMTRYAPR